MAQQVDQWNQPIRGVEGVVNGVALPVSGTVTANQGTAGAAAWLAAISSMTAAKVQNGKLPQTSITCAVASTNVAAAANIPAGTQYLRLYCASAAMVAIGEATSATLGAWIAGGQVHIEPLLPADVTAGMAVNAQSPTAGAVVYITYMSD